MSGATLFSSVRSPHCLKVAIVLDEVDAALRRQRGRWLVPTGAGRDPTEPGGSGPAPSLADVAVYAWASGYSRFGLPRNAASLPALRSWLARMAARPSVRASRGVAAGSVGRPFDDWLRERATASPSETGAQRS